MRAEVDNGSWDEQDQAEILDEDNFEPDDAGAPTAEMKTFEELPDVLDVTSAVGDADDEAGLIGEDLDDDDIIDLETDAAEADAEDDELAARMPEALDVEPEGGDDAAEPLLDAEPGLDDGDRQRSVQGKDEAELIYAGDLQTSDSNADPAALEADRLADDDIADLGYGENGGEGDATDGTANAPTLFEIAPVNSMWSVSRDGKSVRDYSHLERCLHETGEIVRELRHSGQPARVLLYVSAGRVIEVTDDEPLSDAIREELQAPQA